MATLSEHRSRPSKLAIRAQIGPSELAVGVAPVNLPLELISRPQIGRSSDRSSS
ncbi:hypothetical protein TIFTF001_038132 [Ficus carica]|uniref:Uncharacterized protein n=1 Tax=Ficus carica TaxID=3494 RepID=A0AA88JE95_FICCA|nr:hypothetical protein TIFTF001_038132 [Ficus carica]